MAAQGGKGICRWIGCRQQCQYPNVFCTFHFIQISATASVSAEYDAASAPIRTSTLLAPQRRNAEVAHPAAPPRYGESMSSFGGRRMPADNSSLFMQQSHNTYRHYQGSHETLQRPAAASATLPTAGGTQSHWPPPNFPPSRAVPQGTGQYYGHDSRHWYSHGNHERPSGSVSSHEQSVVGQSSLQSRQPLASSHLPQSAHTSAHPQYQPHAVESYRTRAEDCERRMAGWHRPTEIFDNAPQKHRFQEHQARGSDSAARDTGPLSSILPSPYLSGGQYGASRGSSVEVTTCKELINSMVESHFIYPGALEPSSAVSAESSTVVETSSGERVPSARGSYPHRGTSRLAELLRQPPSGAASSTSLHIPGTATSEQETSPSVLPHSAVALSGNSSASTETSSSARTPAAITSVQQSPAAEGRQCEPVKDDDIIFVGATRPQYSEEAVVYKVEDESEFTPETSHSVVQQQSFDGVEDRDDDIIFFKPEPEDSGAQLTGCRRIGTVMSPSAEEGLQHACELARCEPQTETEFASAESAMQQDRWTENAGLSMSVTSTGTEYQDPPVVQEPGCVTEDDVQPLSVKQERGNSNIRNVKTEQMEDIHTCISSTEREQGEESSDTMASACKEDVPTTLQVQLVETYSLHTDSSTQLASPTSFTRKSFQQLSAEGFFRCGNKKRKCAYLTQIPTEFDAHLRMTHADEVSFPCVHCGSEEMSGDCLLQHLEEHLALQSLLLYCTESSCDFNSYSPEEVLQHITVSHTGAITDLTCWRCSASFSTLQSFASHVKQNLIQVVRCPHCSAKDTDRQRIMAHISSSHPGKGRMMSMHKLLLCQERALSAWHAQNAEHLRQQELPDTEPTSTTPVCDDVSQKLVAPEHQSLVQNSTEQEGSIVISDDEIIIDLDENADSPVQIADQDIGFPVQWTTERLELSDSDSTNQSSVGRLTPSAPILPSTHLSGEQCGAEGITLPGNDIGVVASKSEPSADVSSSIMSAEDGPGYEERPKHSTSTSVLQSVRHDGEQDRLDVYPSSSIPIFNNECGMDKEHHSANDISQDIEMNRTVKIERTESEEGDLLDSYLNRGEEADRTLDSAVITEPENNLEQTEEGEGRKQHYSSDRRGGEENVCDGAYREDEEDDNADHREESQASSSPCTSDGSRVTSENTSLQRPEENSHMFSETREAPLSEKEELLSCLKTHGSSLPTKEEPIWFTKTYQKTSESNCDDALEVVCLLCAHGSRSAEHHLQHLATIHQEHFRGFACLSCKYFSMNLVDGATHKCLARHLRSSGTAQHGCLNERLLSNLSRYKAILPDSVESMGKQRGQDARGKTQKKRVLAEESNVGETGSPDPSYCEPAKKRRRSKKKDSEGLRWCTLCGYSVFKKENILSHMYKKHQEIMQCPVCSELPRNHQELYSHLSSCHPEEKGDLYEKLKVTNYITYTCGERNSLRANTKSAGIGNRQETQSAQKATKEKLQIGQSDSQKKKDKERLLCNLCQYSVMSKKEMYQHMYKKHKEVMQCIICQEIPNNQRELYHHLCTYHPDEKDFLFGKLKLTNWITKFSKRKPETNKKVEKTRKSEEKVSEEEDVALETVCAAQDSDRDQESCLESRSAAEPERYSPCTAEPKESGAESYEPSLKSISLEQTSPANKHCLETSVLEKQKHVTAVSSIDSSSDVPADLSASACASASGLTQMEYRCPHCTSIIKITEKFHAHLCYHYHYRCFRCGYCDFRTFSKGTIVNHVNAQHPEHKECPKILHVKNSNMEARIQRVMRDNHVPISSPYTEKRLKAMERAELRKSMKKAEKALQRKERIKLTKKNTLKIKSKDSSSFRIVKSSASSKPASGEKRLLCPYCRNKWKTVTSVETEIRFHIHYKPFSCPYCTDTPVESSSEGHIRTHIQRVHPGHPMDVKMSMIPVKEERFRDLLQRAIDISKSKTKQKSTEEVKKKYKIHCKGKNQTLHRKKAQISDSQTGSTASDTSQEALSFRIRDVIRTTGSEADTLYSCGLCSFSTRKGDYPQGGAYKRVWMHAFRKHGPQKAVKFQCPFCPSRYSSRANVVNHIKRAHPEKSWKKARRLVKRVHPSAV